jgi:hypothetical protein
MKVHTGTLWTVPCSIAGLVHTYHRRMVSVDIANDLEAELADLRKAVWNERRWATGTPEQEATQQALYTLAGNEWDDD